MITTPYNCGEQNSISEARQTDQQHKIVLDSTSVSQELNSEDIYIYLYVSKLEKDKAIITFEAATECGFLFKLQNKNSWVPTI